MIIIFELTYTAFVHWGDILTWSSPLLLVVFYPRLVRVPTPKTYIKINIFLNIYNGNDVTKLTKNPHKVIEKFTKFKFSSGSLLHLAGIGVPAALIQKYAFKKLPWKLCDKLKILEMFLKNSQSLKLLVVFFPRGWWVSPHLQY